MSASVSRRTHPRRRRGRGRESVRFSEKTLIKFYLYSNSFGLFAEKFAIFSRSKKDRNKNAKGCVVIAAGFWQRKLQHGEDKRTSRPKSDTRASARFRTIRISSNNAKIKFWVSTRAKRKQKHKKVYNSKSIGWWKKSLSFLSRLPMLFAFIQDGIGDAGKRRRANSSYREHVFLISVLVRTVSFR